MVDLREKKKKHYAEFAETQRALRREEVHAVCVGRLD
jgi:hypothetical protein